MTFYTWYFRLVCLTGFPVSNFRTFYAEIWKIPKGSETSKRHRAGKPRVVLGNTGTRAHFLETVIVSHILHKSFWISLFNLHTAWGMNGRFLNKQPDGTQMEMKQLWKHFKIKRQLLFCNLYKTIVSKLFTKHCSQSWETDCYYFSRANGHTHNYNLLQHYAADMSVLFWFSSIYDTLLVAR